MRRLARRGPRRARGARGARAAARGAQDGRGHRAGLVRARRPFALAPPKGRCMSEPRVHDHAVIGDGRCAALVAPDGAIDWLCWPRFDSPSLFAAILDPDRGGRFLLRPGGPRRARRAYLEGTNVLATTFETPGGTLRLLDAMAVAEDSDAAAELLPEHELLRVAECVRG